MDILSNYDPAKVLWMREKDIHEKVSIWLHNFLNDRSKEISVNDILSNLSTVTIGIPQEMVSGPLMFLILIDSLGETKIKALITAFADYTKVT